MLFVHMKKKEQIKKLEYLGFSFDGKRVFLKEVSVVGINLSL